MAKDKDLKKEDSLSDVENALTQTEHFIEKNQKILTIAIGAVVVIVGGFLAFKAFYVQPREKSAQEQIFMAEQYFEKDSFNLAINGDGNYLGFLDIIDDYGSTKAGKLANYYTGIAYLHLGQYQEALDYLSNFETDDPVLAPVAEGAKGDAYAELDQTDKALSAYKKAYGYTNEFTAPVYMMKAGKLLESTGKSDQALALYREIKEKYSETPEGRTIDKYIARAQVLQAK